MEYLQGCYYLYNRWDGVYQFLRVPVKILDVRGGKSTAGTLRVNQVDNQLLVNEENQRIVVIEMGKRGEILRMMKTDEDIELDVQDFCAAGKDKLVVLTECKELLLVGYDLEDQSSSIQQEIYLAPLIGCKYYHPVCIKICPRFENIVILVKRNYQTKSQILIFSLENQKIEFCNSIHLELETQTMSILGYRGENMIISCLCKANIDGNFRNRQKNRFIKTLTFNSNTLEIEETTLNSEKFGAKNIQKLVKFRNDTLVGIGMRGEFVTIKYNYF